MKPLNFFDLYLKPDDPLSIRNDSPEDINSSLLKFGATIRELQEVDDWINIALTPCETHISLPLEIKKNATLVWRQMYCLLLEALENIINKNNIKKLPDILEMLFIVISKLDQQDLLEGLIKKFLELGDKDAISDLPSNLKTVLYIHFLKNGYEDQVFKWLDSISDQKTIEYDIGLIAGNYLAHNGKREHSRRLISMMNIETNGHQRYSPNKILKFIDLQMQSESIDSARQTLLNMNPDKINSNEELGVYMAFLIRTGFPKKALKISENLMRVDNPWTETYFYRAVANRCLFKYAQAFESIDLDETYNGEREQNVYCRGQFLWETDHHEKACELINFSLSHSKYFTTETQGTLHNLLAVIYRSRGLMGLALSEHEKAVKMYPKTWRVYFEKALTLQYIDKFNDALNIASQGAEQYHSVNNLCIFLEQSLRSNLPGHVLSPDSAKQCFYHSRNMLAPWFPLQAWAALLACKSFYFYGMKKELSSAIESLRYSVGFLHRKYRTHACDLLIKGDVMKKREYAKVYARAAFPFLPETSIDHQILIKEAIIN